VAIDYKIEHAFRNCTVGGFQRAVWLLCGGATKALRGSRGTDVATCASVGQACQLGLFRLGCEHGADGRRYLPPVLRAVAEAV